MTNLNVATTSLAAPQSEAENFLTSFLAMSDTRRRRLLKKVFSRNRREPIRSGDVDMEIRSFLAAGKTQRLDYIRNCL